MPAVESGRFLELIEQEKVWFAGGVSSMLIAAVEHPEVAERDLSSWQATMSGGAQVPETLVQRLEDTLGLNITIYYGQTECGVLTSTSPSDSTHDKSVTAGQPLPHTELRLVDPVSLSTVTLDRSGEIWARGYFSMLGYLDDPQSTNEPLREGNWVRTGDVATMDQRGYLSIVGRLKDMIIRGGENLLPSEIEDVLYHHPAVEKSQSWGYQMIIGAKRSARSSGQPTRNLHRRSMNSAPTCEFIYYPRGRQLGGTAFPDTHSTDREDSEIHHP